MNENNNVLEMDIEAKEVISVEEKTETFKAKAKNFFKKNGKKIVKRTIIGGSLLTLGFVLGKKADLVNKVDVSELDIDVTEF